MSTKLFVGNLPFGMSDKEFSEIFTPYGEVSEAMIIVDKRTGRSKGFGFVTFNDKEAADKATAELNGKDVGGRKLTVNEAKPFDPTSRPPRREGFGGGRRFGGGDRGFGGPSRRF